MYFWKVDNLVDDIKSDRLTQNEEYKYFLLSTIVSVVVSSPIIAKGTGVASLDIFNLILGIAFSVWGVTRVFKINSKGDNKDLLKRVMCIGLPVIVRTMVYITPIIMVLFVIVELISKGSVIETSEKVLNLQLLVESLTIIFYNIFYYIYLGKKIKSVSEIDTDIE